MLYDNKGTFKLRLSGLDQTLSRATWAKDYSTMQIASLCFLQDQNFSRKQSFVCDGQFQDMLYNAFNDVMY